MLADAAYGDETAWANGRELLPPKPWGGRGAKPELLRRAPGREPMSVADVAGCLPAGAWKYATWCEDTNAPLSSLTAHRLTLESSKIHTAISKVLALPTDYIPRGQPTRMAALHSVDPNISTRIRARNCPAIASLALMRRG